jgi:hypothetical protein
MLGGKERKEAETRRGCDELQKGGYLYGHRDRSRGLWWLVVVGVVVVVVIEARERGGPERGDR